MSTERPLLAVTMGDPAGVGPEVCLHLLANEALLERCTPLVFGHGEVLKRVARCCGFAEPALLSLEDWQAGQRPATACALNLRAIDATQVEPGRFNSATGQASYHYIDQAIDAAIAGRVAAVVTAPINKEALRAAGIDLPGHTEIFAQRTSATRWCMMQYSAQITCSFVTVHVGYADVPSLLSVERVLEVIELTASALRQIRRNEPQLVVCGLNPHAGEHGLFGNHEEERFIIPAIEAARRQGIQVEGPLPPDTAFLPEKRATTDAFVCMYHDQGHIPVKALAFDSAVNTTLGLPIIRTSVDHGTAGDIAWQGKARPGSLFAAVDLALRLVNLDPAA